MHGAALVVDQLVAFVEDVTASHDVHDPHRCARAFLLQNVETALSRGLQKSW
jgi:hypothetical protein